MLIEVFKVSERSHKGLRIYLTLLSFVSKWDSVRTRTRSFSMNRDSFFLSSLEITLREEALIILFKI